MEREFWKVPDLGDICRFAEECKTPKNGLTGSCGQIFGLTSFYGGWGYFFWINFLKFLVCYNFM